MDLEWNVPALYLGFALALVLGLAAGLLARRLASCLDRLAARLTPRSTNAILVALVVAYVVVFGGLSLLRHEAFHSKAYDLGIFSQVAWNTSRGHWFECTFYRYRPNFLGVHFSPILALIAPLYWLVPDARVLLVLQTLALGVGVLPVYWLARQQLPGPYPLLLSLVYLLLPSLHFVNLFDFHPIALAIPLLAFATYGLLQRRYGLFAACLFLALLCKEEVGFIAVGFGLYLILVQRRVVAGALLAGVGLLWGYVALSLVIPAFGSVLVEKEYSFLERYGYLGNDVGEMALTLLTQPGLVLEHLLAEARLRFVLHHLIPFGLVPLVGLEVFALAGIPLAYLLLSAYEPMYSIQWQYTAPIIPFAALAAVLGCARLLRRWPTPGFRWGLAGFLLAASATSYAFVSPGPLAAYFDPGLYDVGTPRVAAAREALALIPPDSPVMAQSNLGAHLAERPLVRLYPRPLDLHEVEYVVCDPGGHIYSFPSHDAVYLNMERLDANPYYARAFDRDGIVVFQRRDFSPQRAQRVNFGDTLVFLGYDLGGSATTVDVTLYWRSARRIQERYKYFVHLVDEQGQTVAQDDREPGGWRFPTTDWMVGETIPERYEFPLPAGSIAGEYRIRIGVYDPETLDRLSILDPAGASQGTELLLDLE